MGNEEKAKRLIPLKISMEDNDWTLSFESGEKFIKKTTPETMRKALLRMKSKDGGDSTRSHKTTTYKNMMNDVHKGKEVTINVWKSKVPKDKNEFEKLFK